ncbi:transcription antitermination protein [Sinorhizobium phage phi3LM21]|nr:transcription antitermination protein [Sinorhizobium phage phi3LM21]
MIMQRSIYEGAPIDIDDARVDRGRVLKAWARDGMRTIRASMLSMASANQPGVKAWYCLQVLTGREGDVETYLKAANIKYFLPLEKWVAVRRGRKVLSERPLIPGYVFVFCVPSAAAFCGLRGIRHVLDIVGSSEKPYRFDEESINLYKAETESQDDGEQLVDATGKRAAVGDGAKITNGPFADFEGVVVSINKARDRRAKVAIKIYGRDFEVDMPLAHLEKL